MKHLKLTSQGFTPLLLLVVAAGIVVAIVGMGFVVQKNSQGRTINVPADTQKPAQPKTETVTEATPAPAPKPCTPDTTMYVSVADGHNMRSEKSLSSGAVVLLPYASAVKVGCLDGDWYAGDYNGKTGFVYKAYVSATKPVKVALPTNHDFTGCTAYYKGTVVNPSGAKIYKTYGTSPVVATAPYGSTINAKCQDGTRAGVEYNGVKGSVEVADIAR